ncbi:unnamed protein product [Didymodactylos carnosus]|uniref:Reverse transcriptase domain-containing protein n=1 Tax=Didymodactylos carnosus TaxID=1234261 RepID=A0A8S2ETH4_9BILA|nr:unnamed protein product [Didymodactylos carnosus]CAF4109084.1 unnamed protein product [Didymodactylos carnosus]
MKVLAQGLKNGPPTFQRIVDDVLGPHRWQCCLAYLDDILIYSRSFTEHLKHVELVCMALARANFRLNTQKCEVFKTRIDFLGHTIANSGVSPLSDKVRAILEIPEPKSADDVMKFVNTAGYYRNYIQNFSTIAAPLYKFSKKTKNKFSWGPEEKHAFEIIKNRLTEAPVLHHPEHKLPFIIATDASQVGIGAVLMQIKDKSKGPHPIAFMSRKLNAQQQNWSTIERECYAVLEAVRLWDSYVSGNEFIVQTDHHPLCWLQQKFSKNAKLNRWRMDLQGYTMEIIHVSGKCNPVADCLSRFPVDSPINVDKPIIMNPIGVQVDRLLDGNTCSSVNVITRAMAKKVAHPPHLILKNPTTAQQSTPALQTTSSTAQTTPDLMVSNQAPKLVDGTVTIPVS